MTTAVTGVAMTQLSRATLGWENPEGPQVRAMDFFPGERDTHTYQLTFAKWLPKSEVRRVLRKLNATLPPNAALEVDESQIPSGGKIVKFTFKTAHGEDFMIQALTIFKVTRIVLKLGGKDQMESKTPQQ